MFLGGGDELYVPVHLEAIYLMVCVLVFLCEAISQ